MWYTIKPGSWLRNQRRAHELGHHRSPPYYEGSSGCNPPLLVDDSLGFCWGTLKTCLNQKISCGYNWFVWWLVDDYMIWYDIYGVILSNMNHYELGDDHPIHFHWEIRTLKTWSRWYPRIKWPFLWFVKPKELNTKNQQVTTRAWRFLPTWFPWNYYDIPSSRPHPLNNPIIPWKSHWNPPFLSFLLVKAC